MGRGDGGEQGWCNSGLHRWAAQDTNPPGFKPGTGKWPNPFPQDKPLYVITAKNMDEYADKLTETNKALLKRFPDYKLEVYPT
ncbi:DUF1329 domain-containing protein, partial [Herbaspirillum sp. B65]|uniref:DUF1329 domain-containing protein n=1 Tax=Herbaspirillum sp. B65 TaxID=137708 RepID=UPI00209018B0